MASSDPLFACRNSLHLGAPQTCISEAAHLTGLSDDDKVSRDVLTHRAYIEIGSCEVVLNEVSENESHPSLKAVRLLAMVAKDAKGGSSDVSPYVDTVMAWIGDASLCRNETVMVAAATVLLKAGDCETALKACFLGGGLENMAIAVQVCVCTCVCTCVCSCVLPTRGGMPRRRRSSLMVCLCRFAFP
jgi:hypothetical protein